MTRATGDDMTGSALVALMETSFRRQGLSIACLKIRTNGAHASLTDKVALAEAVLRAYGPRPLLRVGAALTEMARDPLAAALLASRSGRDVFDRWQRLERYVHTRHPIMMRDMTDSGATLDHRGHPDDPPSVAVNFILAGLFAHLLRAVGCRDVVLSMGRPPLPVSIDAETLDGRFGPIAADDTGIWQYVWSAAPERMARAEPDADQGDRRGRHISSLLADLFESDPLEKWSLARVASALAVSERTLQRRLHVEGVSLTAVRRRAQIEQASHHLLGGHASLSAIGFSCGFSDLPHFTREFRKHVGMPPSAFRSLSAANNERESKGK